MKPFFRRTDLAPIVCLALFLTSTVLAFSPRVVAQDTQTSSQNSETQTKTEASPQNSFEAVFPDGEGKQTFLQLCSSCHSPESVVGHGQDADGWSATLYKMIQYGMQGTNEDFGAIVYYLSNKFGPAPDKVNVNTAKAMDLRNWVGFTQKQSDAIVSYRKQHGNFKSLDDLKKVPGLDPKMLDAKKDQFTFAAPAKSKSE